VKLDKTEAITGKLVSNYRSFQLSLVQTTGGHYYIIYKDKELDIGDMCLDNGLMEALKWFGDIV
jgi:hypothetical protein